MIKGVNKQILEVTNPESPYFEKIIFFVKPDGMRAEDEKLKAEAERFSNNSFKPPKTRRTKKELITTALCAVLGLGAGCALTVIMGIIA